MLVTDKELLKKYTQRKWQGIPSIDVTLGGRLFVTFYSGGDGEELGNFCVLIKSDDGGQSWSAPVAAADVGSEFRCYDPCVWVDPLGRLWFIWSVMPGALYGAYAAVCEDPDSETLTFGEPFKIGQDVMLNKPTVLKNGDWLFPVAVWKKGIYITGMPESESEPRLAFAYRSRDKGKTFERLGGVDMPARCYDEHMFVESGERIRMYVRTYKGIGVSESSDGGRQWSAGEDTGWGGPCSRFFLRRLQDGRLLLVNHVNYTGRNNLTALLSEDEGKTWKGGLLLDGRNLVSYPDGTERNGFIYIVYDRERGYGVPGVEDPAREILMAKFTPEDVLAGKLVSEGSELQMVVSSLQRESCTVFHDTFAAQKELYGK